jgi:cytochrome c oxidase subunit 2
MTRALLALLLAACAGLAAAETAAPPADRVDGYVALFNQDLYALDAKGRVVTPITGAFDAPASDIARDVARSTWFSLIVFLPFLVLPQVLLIWIIFKYRKRQNEAREPAKFMGNHTLEIVWTAIPCVALVIVGIPMWDLLVKMEAPPADQRRDMVVEVRGKSFAWDYKYQRLGGERPTRREDQYEIGQDVVGMQEPVVLVKDRRVIMNMTANDVNHAWWVPAFGVKKDTIKGRYTSIWFTPEKTGFFKGQCAELCGQGHGIMLISALVVEEPDFQVWSETQRHRGDTVRVWTAISGAQVDAKVLEEAVAGYLRKSDTPWRRFSLRFWIASNFVSLARKPGELKGSALQAAILSRRSSLEDLINRHGAATPAAAVN